MLTSDIKSYISKSVLCWLATASLDHIPNVSPKEVFTYWGDEHLLIANIASPGSIRNIRENRNVCVSFIEIFVQKGFQLKGLANIIEKDHPEFQLLFPPLFKIAGEDFPIASIIKIEISSIKEIIAPRYLLFPETTEADQIDDAKNTYGLNN
ncbi:MAG: pyridoxamine 5'-phosphate oxidase family protein [Bacteroidia bacterium]|nr:pyridoxamine 5'-phosphate oxidase family protein [Bacteroidia bacterium]